MNVEQKLIALHEMLCDDLIERLKNGEGPADETGQRAPASTSTLNVIRQLLKDNDINGVGDDDSPLKELLSELPQEFKDKMKGGKGAAN